MEVMDLSEDPVVFDHSDPKALCDHPRNITDEQIRLCGEKGGVIGLCPISAFLRSDKEPTQVGVGDFIDHVDYVVKLVGVNHVGIGSDVSEEHYSTPQQILKHRLLFPGLGSEKVRKMEDEFLKSGRDRMYSYETHTPWLKSISQMPIITEALLSRGCSEQDVVKIMGENFLRVFERVWGR